MSRRVVLIVVIVGVLGCVAGVLGLVFGILSLTTPVAEAGDAFMQALKDGDHTRAYGLCTSELKEELGSARRLGGIIEERGLRPESWGWNSREISDGQGGLEGGVTYADGRGGWVTLSLVYVQDAWKISDFRLEVE